MRISIEGNVGAGKSTLLARLAARWTVCPEPVDEWRELLGLFYADPTRWAFAMNAKALVSYLRVPECDAAGRPVVVERSPLSCKEVFSRLHLNEGTISSEEWELLSDLHLLRGWEPDVIVYLTSTPGVCMERVKQRGRGGEGGVTPEYLAKLQRAHVTMLRWYGKEVHVIDAAQDEDTVFRRVKDVLEAYDKQIFSGPLPA